MTDFTLEQIREIRDRINNAHTKAACDEPRTSDEYFRGVDTMRDRADAAFPLPKVKRYRTFRAPSLPYLMRVVNGIVEYESPTNGWVEKVFSGGMATVRRTVNELALRGDWVGLAALADVAARPTEEVDA